MRRSCLLGLAVLPVFSCQPAVETTDPAADEAAVLAVLAGLETTWNAVDLDANAEFVHSDMVSLPYGEPAIIGEAANRQWYDAFLAANDDEWHPSAEEVWVSGDLAVAWGFSTSMGGPKGGEITESRSKNVWVFRRGPDGVWQMTLEMWSPETELAQATP